MIWPVIAFAVAATIYHAYLKSSVMARLFGEYVHQRWGQPVAVDNRVGASGNIGTLAVARAQPDGHTMLFTTNAMVMNVSLFASVPYDPVTSFAPVAHIATATFALVVQQSLRVSTLADFIALARRTPGQLIYGSPGVGTPHHLAMELLKLNAGLDIRHIPYRGLAPAVTDLMGDRTSAMFLPIRSGLELARDHYVRVLAVTGAARSQIAPEIPTFSEAGLQELNVDNWWALLAPAGTPANAIDRFNAVSNAFVLDPEIQQKLAEQGLAAGGGPPEHLRDLIASDLVRWARIVKEAGIAPL